MNKVRWPPIILMSSRLRQFWTTFGLLFGRICPLGSRNCDDHGHDFQPAPQTVSNVSKWRSAHFLPYPRQPTNRVLLSAAHRRPGLDAVFWPTGITVSATAGCVFVKDASRSGEFTPAGIHCCSWCFRTISLMSCISKPCFLRSRPNCSSVGRSAGKPSSLRITAAGTPVCSSTSRNVIEPLI